MKLTFPAQFLWGTSTAAGQIETASEHNWKGFKAKDGHLFNRTTDHERRRLKDVDLIARFGTVYRCGVDWARLQSGPYEPFNKAVVEEYRSFFKALHGRRMRIMLVLHHFVHPKWFEQAGGWSWESNLDVFYDFSARCMEAFGDQVFSWNTFNEPNVYALNAYYLGQWPPYKTSLTKASRVLGNMAQAHRHVYARLKERYPSAQVGYSLNTAYAEGKGIRGQANAKFFDWWFYKRPVSLFTPIDYVGVSYYAYLIFQPQPLTAQEHAAELESMGVPHDDMWALRPSGLGDNLTRVYRDTGKPVWVTENGVCTADSEFRIATLRDYLTSVHQTIESGVPVLGYTHWSTWDNFEWDLGPTYRFGLLELDLATMERKNTSAADWYEVVTNTNSVEQ